MFVVTTCCRSPLLVRSNDLLSFSSHVRSNDLLSFSSHVRSNDLLSFSSRP
ncbi:MAG: hypothetical protein ACRC8Y_23340 [Chroococcales cyanobacterium]